MELNPEPLLVSRDLRAVNEWISEQHNCRERGTIVVPAEFWDRADRGAKEIFLNLSRIEGWSHRLDPRVSKPELELLPTP